MTEGIRLTLVDSLADVEELFRWLGQQRQFLGVDTETGGFDWWREPLRTVQFGDAQAGWTIEVGMRGWGAVVDKVLREYEGEIVMANAKFDAHFLGTNGFRVNWGRLHDTRVMGHLLDATRSTGLKQMADRYLGGGSGSQKDLKSAMAANGWNITNCPIQVPQFWQYAAMDPVLTARLAETLYPRIAPFMDVYDVEMGALKVLTEMEQRGIRVDEDFCQAQWRVYGQRIVELEADIREKYEIANPNSNQQLYKRMLDDGASLTKFTPGGQPAIDKEVLQSVNHPLGKAILELRHLTKMRGSYFENFLNFGSRDADGLLLLHAATNPLGARTGRMSVQRPALQTIPRGPEIRDAFIARPGRQLVRCDFQNMEMRALAHYSQDPNMMQAFLDNQDLHTLTAQRIYGVEEPTPFQRNLCKGAGFAIIFGAGLEKFCLTAGVDLDVGEAFLERWHGEYANVKPFQNAVSDRARARRAEDGIAWVKTPLGRRQVSGKDDDYKLVNYLIQGGCADVFKQSLCKLAAADMDRYLVLPIHDEVISDVPDEDVEDFERELQEVMTFREWSVPLTVSVKHSARWGSGEAYAEAILGDDDEETPGAEFTR